jgi:hypothetical protein
MLLFEPLDPIQLKELFIEEVTRVCITSECAQILQILLLFSFCVLLEGISILNIDLSRPVSSCVLSLHVFF